MQETFRLVLNQSWEAINIQTGAPLVIPKGSHKAVRILHRTAHDAKEEPWLIVMLQQQGKPVSAGLREAFWRQWERHHVPEFNVTIERSEEHTSELQSRSDLVCRLLLEKKNRSTSQFLSLPFPSADVNPAYRHA